MGQQNAADALMQRIAREYDDLSRQLKQIAQYIEHNRQRMVVARIQELAEACQVQPSAVVRFAQRFGFSGYSEMQGVFRDAWGPEAANSSYQQRIRAVIESHPARMRSSDVARGFLEACQAGLDDLRHGLDDSAFEAAVTQLQVADHIYVIAVRRMFPVAAYLGYALQHTRKRVVLLDGVGGMLNQQLQGLRAGDVLVAVSMPPYGPETRRAVKLARQRKARVLALTDSVLSPIAREADVVLQVRESEAYSFRALASPMSLAQSLFIALAYRLELNIAQHEHHEHPEEINPHED
ncbi:MAG: MurR/RpiR family transcriptional regulator [Pseudomonadota bacterium]|nr:MurR/RpiR family transcriptional regulator [Pseudomonadota bacterium]